jgi:hypothetical protein
LIFKDWHFRSAKFCAIASQSGGTTGTESIRATFQPAKKGNTLLPMVGGMK